VTLIDRIERATGVPGLAAKLGDLPPADLRSLLLEVHRRQAARVTPAQVLKQYQQDRFTGTANTDPSDLAAYDVFAYETLKSRGYTSVELSPICPLGTVSALSGMDQNRVVSTGRGTEVMADATNALALESAVRREGRERVKLCTSHRLVRAQPFPQGWLAHFRLLALTIAGRDEGSFTFETESLLDLLGSLATLISHLPETSIAITDLTGRRQDVLTERVLTPLTRAFPQVKVDFDQARQRGRGYYTDVCFDVSAGGISLADGGFTTWTRQLLGNAKERLLTGGLGLDNMHANFGPRRPDPYS
jgi:hypothetical protein